MAIDSDLLREHHRLLGLMSDALHTFHGRIGTLETDRQQRSEVMNATLQAIKTNIADLNTKVDTLIAAKSDQDLADEAAIKADLDAIDAKLTAALTPAPTAAATDAPAA